MLHLLSYLWLPAGLFSAAFIVGDQRRRQPQPMKVMNYVRPINALWFGLIGICAYVAIGRTVATTVNPQMDHTEMDRAKMGHSSMQNMDGPSHPFWQQVVTGTLHCGAGCVLADLVGQFLFRAVLSRFSEVSSTANGPSILFSP
jgi:hypothetical protein